ncbi:MAG TPA: triose-phosphate isomerase [Candidatus Limnocylindria bacterium]|nr:triose-phosphate isomerase [Candidatus Limnocylindria bacterium]
MSRIPLLAGNWKMHGTRREALALVHALLPRIAEATGRQVLLAPPFTALEAVAEAIAGHRVFLGAQNVHWEPKGAFTGEVSVAMLKEAKCTHVIVGHSERRQYFGETDETVGKRTRAALAGGLVPIVCVGETLAQRDDGTTNAVVTSQLEGALGGIPAADLGRLVVAYEPVWAIGTGRTATPAQAQEVHAVIRQRLATLASAVVAQSVRILYGGSVKPDNVDALMAEPDIDGALVGGASLDAEAFARIVNYEESR